MLKFNISLSRIAESSFHLAFARLRNSSSGGLVSGGRVSASSVERKFSIENFPANGRCASELTRQRLFHFLPFRLQIYTNHSESPVKKVPPVKNQRRAFVVALESDESTVGWAYRYLQQSGKKDSVFHFPVRISCFRTYPRASRGLCA